MTMSEPVIVLPFCDAFNRAAKPLSASDLPALRRLYHHMASGGMVNAVDEWRTGISPLTLDALSRRIAELENACLEIGGASKTGP